MNIYSAIVIVAVAASVILGQNSNTEKQSQVTINRRDECKFKTNISKDDMRLFARSIPTSSRSGQCYRACIYKTVGMMYPDNKINVEIVKKNMIHLKETSTELYNKHIANLDKCIAQEKPELDECEAARKFSECLYNTGEKVVSPLMKKYKTSVEECKPKANATVDDISLVMIRAVPESRTGQCLLACMMKQNGWMELDNRINVENAKKVFEPIKETHKVIYQKMIKNLENCKSQELSETDECMAAKKIADCMWIKY